jgi:predicted dehydrogenase
MIRRMPTARNPLRLLPALLLFAALPAVAASPDKPIRIGIIGLDTSHVVAFTKEFNDPKAGGELAGFRIVAGFPGGSPDIESSRSRVQDYANQLKALGVEIVPSIPELLTKVDAVLLESVDGRPHLEQARPVIAARKPLFIDKPLAASLADGIAIAELAKRNNVPFFSSSSLRFGAKVQAIRHDPKLGDIVGADAWSPCTLEEHHPDLYWYGVHGVETLYTIMGTGCESVRRISTPDTEIVVGLWHNNRVGTFRGTRTGKHDYGVVAFGTKGTAAQIGFEGYKPLAEQIARFFKTGKTPIAPEETLEILAFMQAADDSKRANGAPIKLADVMARARAEASQKLDK